MEASLSTAIAFAAFNSVVAIMPQALGSGKEQWHAAVMLQRRLLHFPQSGMAESLMQSRPAQARSPFPGT
jgi:hypothetical protein